MFSQPGFNLPQFDPVAALEDWLRGPLRGWGEDLLNDTSTVIGDLVDLATVREVWREHQTTRADDSYRLWVFLMLVAWAREWRPV